MNNLLFAATIPENINLNSAIRELMENMGFCPSLKGFDQMVRAIELIYIDPSKMNGIVKKVYTYIANESAINPSCVERNCRTLLRIRWAKRNTSDISLLPRLHNGKSVPAVKEFIYIACNMLAEHLAKMAKNK